MKSPKSSSTAHQKPTQAPSTTTELAAKTNTPLLDIDSYSLRESEDFHTSTAECIACNPVMTSPGDVDLKAVQYLEVIRTSSHCAALIFTFQKDGNIFCSDLGRFLLQNLEVPSPQEEHVVAGCHCYEKTKELPAETLHVTIAMIWLPGENCSSTEFIERLSDGREVCVTPTSLTTYLKTLEEHSSASSLSGIQVVIPNIQRDVKEIVVDAGEDFLVERLPPEIAEPCIHCLVSVNWNSFDPENIQSLELKLPSSDCPALISVSLADGEHICMDSSHHMFVQLLKKLESKKP